MNQIRVAVVDDHPYMREGLKDLLAVDDEFELISESGSSDDARRALDEAEPHIAVDDLSLPSTEDGLDLVRWIRQYHPQVRVLVLSMLDEALYAERLLRLGVNGYLMKDAAGDELMNALRNVAKGRRHLSQQMHERMVELIRSTARSSGGSGTTHLDPIKSLSAREIEVLRLLGYGVATRDLAKELNMSVKTVDAHRRRLREKLGLRTTSELIRYASQWIAEQGTQAAQSGQRSR